MNVMKQLMYKMWVMGYVTVIPYVEIVRKE